MRQEIAKQTKMREAIQKRFHQIEDQKADVDVQRETLKAQIAGLEKGKGAGPVPLLGSSPSPNRPALVPICSSASRLNLLSRLTFQLLTIITYWLCKAQLKPI